MNEGRLKHCYTVATKMVEFGKARGYSEEKLHDLFILGFNHDIGYEFGSSKNHGEVGGEMLKQSGYKYWQEVRYHGKADADYESEYLDILNAADMSVDGSGNDVGVDNRLEDIKSRHGEDSDIYLCCKNLVQELKNKGVL
ncbi:MAG: HD domain-containing protein [Clostridia bacterium]|nr:HD domain-containing protein [Clostridia bacterium]